MNICILTQTFPRFAGDMSAPFMEGLAKGLCQKGNKVFVLTPYSPLFPKKETKKPYSLLTYRYMLFDSWHQLGYSQTLENDKKLRLRAYLLSPFLIICGFFTLLSLVKKEKIDVISAHWILPNGFIATLVRIFTKVKVVSTLPGSDVYISKVNPVFHAMALFAANNSDGITSNSPQLIKDLQSLGAHIKKFKRIIYGVDPHVFFPDKRMNQPLRRKYTIPAHHQVVMAVGRLVEKKGFTYLINAAKEIVTKYKKVTFLIVGEGSQRPELEALIKRNHLQSYICLTGGVGFNQLKNYYNLGDIFILPSIRDKEGNLDDQSVSVIEAMSCGKPVITSNFPGYQYIIQNTKTGFLISEKNSREIAKTILDLLHSPAKQKKIGKQARISVENHFSWSALGKEYISFFDSL